MSPFSREREGERESAEGARERKRVREKRWVSRTRHRQKK